MLDVMAIHIFIVGFSSSLCEHQLVTKLSFYHLLAHIVGVSFTRPLDLFSNNHGSLGHMNVQPRQNKHRNYYWPLKITPSKHKCLLYTVETEHASLALWTGNMHFFPVVCDHMVIGPRWFQLSNQTKQILKANIWEIHYRKRIISFPLAWHLACLAKHDATSRGFSPCSPSCWFSARDSYGTEGESVMRRKDMEMPEQSSGFIMLLNITSSIVTQLGNALYCIYAWMQFLSCNACKSYSLLPKTSHIMLYCAQLNSLESVSSAPVKINCIVNIFTL